MPPLTEKGEKIKAAMTREYGAKKAEQVFYASRNAGRISGVDSRGRYNVETDAGRKKVGK